MMLLSGAKEVATKNKQTQTKHPKQTTNHTHTNKQRQKKAHTTQIQEKQVKHMGKYPACWVPRKCMEMWAMKDSWTLQ